MTENDREIATALLSIMGLIGAGTLGGIPIYNELISTTPRWDIVIICGVIGIFCIAITVVGNILYQKNKDTQ
jgi:hypothetical protein